jgi:CubicO group peptidase (beta-lactamase class C family)
MSPKRTLVAFSLLVMVATIACAADDPSLKLPRSTPEEQGVSSTALLGFVLDAEHKLDALNSFMLVRHGHVVAEGWWSPYASDVPHTLYSLSKIFMSTAVGLAAAEGKLSLDDPILKFFPGEAPAIPSKNLSSMRVRDLLRMSTGQEGDFINSDFRFDGMQNLIRAFLELPVTNRPGTHFVYRDSSPYMLSAIVQKVTGQTVLDYLRPRLFEPLGISDPKWETSAQGISLGGTGLSLRTEDIAHIGQLYLQRGQWRGRQLVPAAWVDAATSLQTSTGSDPRSDWDQGYGYFFWRCRHGFYRGDGALGQFCIVMPEFDAVLAITSGDDQLQSILDFVWERILPAFKDSALPADPESDRRLSEKLASLTLRTQNGEATSPAVSKIVEKRFVFPENEQQIESIEFEPEQKGANITIIVRIAGNDQRIVCGRGAWVKGTLAAEAAGLVPMAIKGVDTGGPGPIAIAASGAWSGDDTYTVKLCRYTTPYIWTYDLRFEDNKLILEGDNNLSRSSAGPGKIRLVGPARP